MKKHYKIVIFDWDGTLADSTAKIVDAMHGAADAVNLDRTSDAAVKHIIGLGLEEAILELWPGLNSSRLKDVREAYSHYFVNVSQIEMPFYEGAIDLVSGIRDVQVKTAVATGKSRKGLDRIFENEQVGHLFDYSRCADETRSKPHPLMLEELLDVSGIAVEDALMVGDTSYDLEMAMAIGMDSVGMSHGAHDTDTLDRFKPKEIVDDLPALKNWLFS